MRNGHVFFDLVVHIYNFLSDNFETRTGRVVQAWKYDHVKMLRDGVRVL
jgi:hypothetical protein